MAKHKEHVFLTHSAQRNIETQRTLFRKKFFQTTFTKQELCVSLFLM